MTYYKVLNMDGTSCNGGIAQWNLPHGKRPGKWMPAVKDIALCERGYHICNTDQLVQWLGPAIYEVEYRGEIIESPYKCVAEQARLIRKFDTWTERSARLFACDCADEALKLVKEPDPRSIEAVRVARLYAIGETSKENLAAAWAAARAAAWDAAWDAARDAAIKWQTEKLFEYLGE
jgi:hypothetical protein